MIKWQEYHRLNYWQHVAFSMVGVVCLASECWTCSGGLNRDERTQMHDVRRSDALCWSRENCPAEREEKSCV
jgi:hypothetical protein